MTNTAKPERAFIATAALVFAASTAVTIAWCSSMSSMPGMPWMRMPDQSWPAAVATFLGMWIVMMIAMMLPALAPMLLRYQRAVNAVGAPRLAGLTIVVAVAYFLVWAAFGLAVYPVGIALAETVMTRPSLARMTPLALGLVVMIAGLLQFSAWKARQLACCRATPAQDLRADSRTAFRHGLLLGIRCSRCCLGLTAILFSLGVMDLRAMAMVTAAIGLERHSPAGYRLAHLTGALAALAGLWVIVRTAL